MARRVHVRKRSPRPIIEFKELSIESYVKRLEEDKNKMFRRVKTPKDVDIGEYILNKPFKDIPIRGGIPCLKDMCRLNDDRLIFMTLPIFYCQLSMVEVFTIKRGRATTYLLIAPHDAYAYEIVRRKYHSEKEVWEEDDDNYFRKYKKMYKSAKIKLALKRKRDKRYEEKQKAKSNG